MMEHDLKHIFASVDERKRAHADWTEWLRKIVENPDFSLEALLDHFNKHIREVPREESNEKSWFSSTINMVALLLRATDYRADIFLEDIDYAECNRMFERHEKKITDEHESTPNVEIKKISHTLASASSTDDEAATLRKSQVGKKDGNADLAQEKTRKLQLLDNLKEFFDNDWHKTNECGYDVEKVLQYLGKIGGIEAVNTALIVLETAREIINLKKDNQQLSWDNADLIEYKNCADTCTRFDKCTWKNKGYDYCALFHAKNERR